MKEQLQRRSTLLLKPLARLTKPQICNGNYFETNKKRLMMPKVTLSIISSSSLSLENVTKIATKIVHPLVFTCVLFEADFVPAAY